MLETNTKQEFETRQRVGRHTPHRMEVWLIKIDRERESPFLRSGYFPAVVVSNEKSNINSDVVNVVPARTSPRRLDLPSHVWLTCENNPSLERDMTMLAEQMTSIDKRSLVKQLGKVTSEEDIEKVEIAVLKQLGFEVEECTTHSC